MLIDLNWSMQSHVREDAKVLTGATGKMELPFPETEKAAGRAEWGGHKEAGRMQGAGCHLGFSSGPLRLR